MMVQTNPQEEDPHQEAILSSSDVPSSPVDFITSSVRKRKPGKELHHGDKDRRRTQRSCVYSQESDYEQTERGQVVFVERNNHEKTSEHIEDISSKNDLDKEELEDSCGTIFSPSFGCHQNKARCQISGDKHAALVGSKQGMLHMQSQESLLMKFEENLESVGSSIKKTSEVVFHDSKMMTMTENHLEEHDNDDQDSSDVEIDDEDFEEIDFDPFVFIKQLPSLHECIPPRTSYLLPRQTRHSKFRKTLVLDLDETLVHSSLDGDCTPDFTFTVDVGTIAHVVAVRKRPHLQIFLEHMASRYEVVVFTASQQVYAEQLLDLLDPEKKLIKHRIYRDSCVFWEGNYLKDLTYLGRDLAHTLIVDNSPQAFGFQLDNGIPIESWYDDDNDTELLKLIPFLEEILEVEDVRPVIAERFGLRKLVHEAATYL